MTPADFKRLVLDIRRAWTTADGLVVLLTPGKAAEPARLCLPPSMNDLTPQRCLVWRGDELLRDGKLDAPETRKLLTEMKVCRAVLTTGRQLGGQAPSKCYGPESCTRCKAGKC